jgi:hypothetical protein
MEEDRLSAYLARMPKDLWGAILWQLSKCNLLDRGRFVKHLLPRCAAYVDALQFAASNAREWLYDTDVNLVVRLCPGLAELDLSRCRHLMTPRIHHPQLRRLTLLEAGRKEFNPSIDCPQLRALALQLQNIRVFKKQMALLEARSPLLEELHLVGPIDLKVLSIAFPNLHTLRLIGCVSLRMSSILQIIASHPLLVRVILDEFLRPELPEALDPPPGDEERQEDDDDTSPRDVGEDQEDEEAATFSSAPEEDAQIREILRRGVVFEFAT